MNAMGKMKCNLVYHSNLIKSIKTNPVTFMFRNLKHWHCLAISKSSQSKLFNFLHYLYPIVRVVATDPL